MAPPVFPPELYSMVIRHATYCPVHFDTSPDPRSWPSADELTGQRGITSDYKTKKALTLVSSQFRSFSLPFLYEVVQVRKSSRMHRLANVLDVATTSSTRGQRDPRKIEYLFVSTWDMFDGKKEIALFSSLSRVLRRCEGLQGFGFYSAVPQTVEPHDFLAAIPMGVRFFDWDALIKARHFTPMVDRISESLTSLRLSKVSVGGKSPPSTTLPKLTYLSVPGVGGHGVIYGLSMPSLTHLHVDISSDDELVRVVEHFGDSLRSASLGNVEPTLLKQLTRSARSLEECTYYYREGMELSWALVNGHPSLQSIVVVVTFFLEADNDAWSKMTAFCYHLQPLTKANFPELRRIGCMGFHPSYIRHSKAESHLEKLTMAWYLSGIEVDFLPYL